MINRNNIYRHLPYLFLVIVAVLLLWKFLQSSGIPSQGDFSFPTTIENWREEFLPLWNRDRSVSNVQNIDRVLLMWPILSIFDMLGMSMESFIKLLILVLFIASLFASYYSIYYLLKKCIKYVDNELTIITSSIIGALIYSYNPWALDRVYAIYFWIAYIVTPLLWIMIIKTKYEYSFSKIIILAILFSLTALTPHYLIFSLLLIMYWVIFDILLDKNKKRRDALAGQYYRIFINTAIVFIIINIYWIVPSVIIGLNSGIDPGYTLEKNIIETFSRNNSLINVLRGTNAWVDWLHWYGSGYNLNTLGGLIWTILSYFGIAGVIIANLLIKKNKILIFLSSTFIFAVVMSEGLNGFSQGFYYWLVFESPFNKFGWILRDPNKFTGYIWLVYSFVLPIVFVLFINKFKLKWKSVLLCNSIIFALCLLIMAPKIDGYLGNYLLPVNIPNEYNQLFSYLRENRDDDKKVLWMAPYEYYDESNLDYGISYKWEPKKIASNVISRSTPMSGFGYYHYVNPFSQYFTYIYPNKNIRDLGGVLGDIGVKYLVYHADITNTDQQVEQDLNWLNSQETLHLIKQYDFIYLYEVDSEIRNKITVYDKNSVVIGGLDSKRILAEFGLSTSPYLFAEQDISNNTNIDLTGKTEEVVFNSATKLDLFPYYLNNDEMLWIAEQSKNKLSNTGWSYMQTHNRYETLRPWHNYLNNWLQINDGYDFDYSRGVVMSNESESVLTTTYDAQSDDDYYVLIRALRNRHGGTLTIKVNDNAVAFNSFSDTDSFVTYNLGLVSLNKGKNNIYLTNLSGHNVVNNLIIIKKDRYPKILNDVESFLGNAKSIYIQHSNTPIFYDDKDNYLAGTFINAKVFKDDTYSIDTSGDATDFCIESLNDNNNIIYKNEMTLIGNQDYVIKTFMPNSVKSYKIYELEIDNHLVLDNDKIKFTSGTSCQNNSDWYKISAPLIEVSDINAYFETIISFKNLKQLHIKADYFDESNNLIGSNILNRGMDNDVDNELINSSITCPSNARRLQLSVLFQASNMCQNSELEIKKMNVEYFGKYTKADTALLTNQTDPPQKATKKKVDYAIINSAEYKIQSQLDSKENYIILTESYDPLWRLKLDSGEILKPFAADSALTGFYVSGTNISGEIYYLPQKSFNLYLLVSGITLVGCVGYLGYDWRKRRRRREKKVISLAAYQERDSEA